MIPIVDFCWQNFNPIEIEVWNVSIGKLVDLAGKHDQKDPFVIVYCRQYHLSVLVIDDVVVQLAESLRLSPDESAVDTGLLDLLRQGQVTVGQNERAGRVAELAIEHDIEVAIAVNYDAIPIGLFIPGIVTERLPQTTEKLGQSSLHLQKTIGKLAKVDDLPQAIIALEDEFNHYNSECLSRQDIRSYICEDHGKEHRVLGFPCRRHPDAVVRKK